VDSLDWKSRNKTAILNTVFNQQGVKDGSIILLHDIHKTTVDTMDEMITRLKNQGYTLVTVPELLEARKGIVPGQTYSNGYKG
jgi:peptidoglycan/xylan/chitin deacetylase (PgdA/CDA1 family)